MNGSSSTMRCASPWVVTTLRSTTERKGQCDRRAAPGVVRRELAAERGWRDVLRRRPLRPRVSVELARPRRHRPSPAATTTSSGAAQLGADTHLEPRARRRWRLDAADDRRRGRLREATQIDHEHRASAGTRVVDRRSTTAARRPVLSWRTMPSTTSRACMRIGVAAIRPDVLERRLQQAPRGSRIVLLEHLRGGDVAGASVAARSGSRPSSRACESSCRSRAARRRRRARRWSVASLEPASAAYWVGASGRRSAAAYRRGVRPFPPRDWTPLRTRRGCSEIVCHRAAQCVRTIGPAVACVSQRARHLSRALVLLHEDGSPRSDAHGSCCASSTLPRPRRPGVERRPSGCSPFAARSPSSAGHR